MAAAAEGDGVAAAAAELVVAVEAVAQHPSRKERLFRKRSRTKLLPMK